jgi:hypothetical protein
VIDFKVRGRLSLAEFDLPSFGILGQWRRKLKT